MNRQAREGLEKQLRAILWGKDVTNLAAAVADAEDWEVHMQLSPLRQSLLNWYEFKPDTRLLEINAGYGALTALFCERCKTVTSVTATLEEAEILKKRCENQKNLQVLCEESGKMREFFREIQKEDNKFDYVVVLGSIEYAREPAKAIRQWMQYLKPEGTLLLTADNRYGLKYFCGAKEPHTLIPFDGVNGYLDKTACTGNRSTENPGQCLSRKELVDAIEGAGISCYQFYYPVPDGRMPQMIFSDHYKKGTNTAERLADYNYEDPAMLGVEHRMFCEMINNSALPFMANTFLVELTREGALSDIVYAVTTTDRGKEWGMATTIRSSGLVKKRALWAEGEKKLLQLHAHTKELAGRGIPIVPTKLEKDSGKTVLSMPYIDEEGLSTVMKRLALKDGEKFVRMFDEIYGYMMASSKIVEDANPIYGRAFAANRTKTDDGYDGESAVSSKETDDGYDGESAVSSKGTGYGYDGESAVNRRESGTDGVILEKAYLDLAPCNCFYVKETGSLLFYDQEFVMENCPLQFAMFRTLKYSYASAKVMEQAVPLQKMYARYGIDREKEAEFEAREAEFIQEVRNMEDYRRIFQWATPDYRRICARMKRLAEPEKTAKGKKPYHTGYVPGVFDLFHTGHLNLLERCKSRCDYLIVGVLTDELVKFYKGSKTVIPYEDRARIIRSLQIVDEVIPVDFSNTDKLDAWNQLHYDCHFSGDDHRKHWEDVWEELKKRGSNMEFFPYTQGISSTQLREKLK